MSPLGTFCDFVLTKISTRSECSLGMPPSFTRAFHKWELSRYGPSQSDSQGKSFHIVEPIGLPWTGGYATRHEADGEAQALRAGKQQRRKRRLCRVCSIL